MNAHDYQKLLTSLDTALQILEDNRTPDSAVIAAFDTLKQARAKVVSAMEPPPGIRRDGGLIPV